MSTDASGLLIEEEKNRDLQDGATEETSALAGTDNSENADETTDEA